MGTSWPPVTAESGDYRLAPGNSPGILNVGDFDLQSGATLEIEIGGPLVGTDYDQLNVTGTVTLAGSLSAVLINGYEPPASTPFTIINNDGADAIVGNFEDLPEGSKVIIGSDEFFITYKGGDGNDVVLGAAPPIVNWVGLGDGSTWEDPDNWEGGVLPTSSQQAVINVSGSDPQIIVASNVHVHNLVSNEPIKFASGIFTTTATAELNAVATLAGGTLADVRFIGTGTLDLETSDQFLGNSSDGTLDGVTLGIDTTVRDGAQITVLNGLMLEGGITLRLERVSGSTPVGYDVGLNFDGSQTLGGSGVVELFSNSNVTTERYTRIQPTSGTLTIGAGITIRNDTNSYFTTIGNPLLPLVIEGTVVSQTSKPDYTNNGLRIVGSSVTNHGTISVTSGLLDAVDKLDNQGTIHVSGGVLRLDGSWTSAGTIDQSGGTIRLLDTFTVADLGTFTGTGGTVNIEGTLEDPGATLLIDADRTWQLDGGTLSQVTVDGEAGSLLSVTSADGTFDRITLGVDTTLLNGSVVSVQGDLALDNATLSLTRTSTSITFTNNVLLNFVDGTSQTLGGTGSVVLFNNSANSGGASEVRVASTAGGSLTIGPGITVQNRSDSHITSVGHSSSTLINQGTITGLTTETFRGSMLVTGNSVLNQGTLGVSSGELDVENLSGIVGDLDIAGGILDLDGTYQVNQQIDVPSGGLRLRGNWVNNATINQTGGTIYLLDEFQVADLGNFIGTAGTISIGGTLLDPGNTLMIDADRAWQLAGGTLSQVTIDGDAGAVFEVSSADGTFDRVTLATDTTLLNGAVVSVQGDLTLDDVTLSLTRTSSDITNTNNVRLDFVDSVNQTLGGSGNVILFNNSASSGGAAEVRVSATLGGSLTIGPGIQVQNRSDSHIVSVGYPSYPLIIQGTITGQTNETFNSSMLVTGSSVVNQGKLRVSSGELDVENLTGNAGDLDIAGGILDLGGSYQINQQVDVPSGGLRLRGDWTNHATIDQTGGTIYLLDEFQVADLGDFIGTAGTISIGGTLLDPGNTLTIDADRTWQLAGGTLSQVTIDGDANAVFEVSSADGTFDRVTLATDTTLLNGAVVSVQGNLTLDNATLSLTRTSTVVTGTSDVRLNFIDGATQTLGGNGTVELFNARSSSSSQLSVGSTAGGQLIIASGITLQNRSDSHRTTVGHSSSTLLIEGTILSQSTETSNFRMLVTGSAVTNNGILQSSFGELFVENLVGNLGDVSIGDGDLDLDGDYTVNQPVDVPSGSLTLRGAWANISTINQTGGTIYLLDEFQVSDLGNFIGTAGTISIGGTLLDPGNTLMIDADRTWQVAGGTLSQVTVDGDAGAVLEVTSADGTFDRVTLSTDTAMLIGAVVSVNGDLTLDDVTLSLTQTSTRPTNGDFVRLNFVDAVNQTLGGVGDVVLFNNAGSSGGASYVWVAATEGGSLTIGPGITVQNRSDSHMVSVGFSSYPLTIEGTILGQTSETFNSRMLVTGSTINNNGTLRVTSGRMDVDPSPVNISGTTITGGAWEASGSGLLRLPTGNELTTIAADIVLDGPDAFLETGAGVDAIAGITSIANGGSLTLAGGHDFTTVGDFEIGGTLIIDSGTQFNVPSGSGYLTRGTTIVNGQINSESITVAGGTLGGGGVIPWPVVVTSGGTAAPGNSPGILSVNGFELQSGGTLNIETGGTVAGTDYDQLNVTGTVTLAGDLDIDVFSSIVKGTQFTIVNNDGADAIIGTFAGVPEGSVFDNGYDEYLVTYIGGDGNDVVLTALTDVRAVTNTNDSGVGSLRDELTVANGIAGDVAVIFRIPGSGPFTITPGSALPAVVNRVFIDATTQETFAGLPLVEVSGVSAGNVDGFRFESGSDGGLLRGLAVNGFQQDGVQIIQTNNILVAGNYIGTDLNGAVDVGNNADGIDVYDSQGSIIGGPNLQDRNVISGNDGVGINLRFQTSGTIVEGNYIGIDAAGTGDLGNTGAGVLIEASGSAAEAATGNFIGQVGGAPNVISGNDQQGVLIQDAGVSGNEVVNNYIGLNAEGTGLIANAREGVLITANADGNIVGLAGGGNVIAGTPNPYAAISLETTANVASGNLIGTTADGTSTLGSHQGIKLAAAGNVVGGKSFGDGNTIRGMATGGVDAVYGNQILGNSIFDSDDGIFLGDFLGIDVGPDGVTLAELPVIDLAVSGVSSTRVGGTLVGPGPDIEYRIELFSSPAAGVNGYGEGATYLGFVNVTTGGGGLARFSFETPTLIPVGQFISATSTADAVGTSEFALSVATRPSIVVTNTNNLGGGSLRQAVLDANTAGGGDVIEFNIPGAGPHTVALTSALSQITGRTVIDGRSEPDFGGAPVVEIDGSAATGFGIDFDTGSEGSALFGLVVGGFSTGGVRASGGRCDDRRQLHRAGQHRPGGKRQPDGRVAARLRRGPESVARQSWIAMLSQAIPAAVSTSAEQDRLTSGCRATSSGSAPTRVY